MHDTFAELTAAFVRLNEVLRSVDRDISLASIEVDGGREAAIALRGALSVSPLHPTQDYRSPLVKQIGGVTIKLRQKARSK